MRSLSFKYRCTVLCWFKVSEPSSAESFGLSCNLPGSIWVQLFLGNIIECVLLIMGKKQNRGVLASKSATASPKSSRLPSVSEMSAGTLGGSSLQKKVVEDDRLYLTCFCFSTAGSVYNAEIFDDEQLIQLQMTCAALPSPLFNMMTLVRLYSEKCAKPEDGTPIPENIAAVTEQYAAQFTYVNQKTPDPLCGIQEESFWMVCVVQEFEGILDVFRRPHVLPRERF